MLTAQITASPDVETFFNPVSSWPVSPSTSDHAVRLSDRDNVPDETNDTLEALTTEAEAVSEAFTPNAFIPDTADKVNWVLGKIADRRAAAARIRENAELMAKAEDREADALEWRSGPALQSFARKELEGGKKKSLRLYNGVLGWRTRPAGVSVTNDAAALEWAKENCTEAIAYRLDKKALADVLTATGEVLNFARLTPSEEVFFIK